MQKRKLYETYDKKAGDSEPSWYNPKAGEIFFYAGHRLKCVTSVNCNWCYFNELCNSDASLNEIEKHTPVCTSDHRFDDREVSFIEVDKYGRHKNE